MRIPYVGIPLVSLGWPLALVFGTLIALLLIGLFATWPLMWSTISTEGTDAFDALGRSYGYLFGKPLQYLGYALVAVVLGFLGWFVIDVFAGLINTSTHSAISWGSGNARMAEVADMSVAENSGHAWIDRMGAKLIGFWTNCVLAIPFAFLYSYFWNAAVMVYLLLRRDEDQTEIDEVYLEDEQESFGMPPLKLDAAAVPEPADVPRAAPPAATPPAPPANPPPTSDQPAVE